MNYTIISESELPQGSDRWREERNKGIGASEVATIMGENPYQTAYQFAQIRLGIIPTPDLSNNFNIKRGHQLEPLARDITNQIIGDEYIPCSFQSTTWPFARYSSDGFCKATNSLIEIKCPGEKNHTWMIENSQPMPYYIPQLQWALMITGCDVIYFVSYNQAFPEPIFMVPIKPDKKYQEMMLEKVTKFWSDLQNKILPEMTDADYEDVSSKSFEVLVAAYKSAKELQALANDAVEKSEARIKEVIGERNVIGNGLRITQVERKGSIDYAKIEALKQLDLEQYRKPASKYPKLSFMK
jgi:putative phage-type endonuclease